MVIKGQYLKVVVIFFTRRKFRSNIFVLAFFLSSQIRLLCLDDDKNYQKANFKRHVSEHIKFLIYYAFKSNVNV